MLIYNAKGTISALESALVVAYFGLKYSAVAFASERNSLRGCKLTRLLEIVFSRFNSKIGAISKKAVIPVKRFVIEEHIRSWAN